MLGAIIGDIVGSRFEFHNHKSKQFRLFHPDCRITDDSVMTLAVARAILTAQERIPDRAGDDFSATLSQLTVEAMQELGRKYPDAGYGGQFRQWIRWEDPQPYHSFGNGAAMRVSPAGFAATDRWEAEELATAVTEVTHDHPEGIKGACATAVVIAMARAGALKAEIRDLVRERFYPLDFTIDAIRPDYIFEVSCQATVPQAIQCFLESSSFEDTLRTAVSLGGDSDTLGAIAGAMAEAYYGIPEDLRNTARSYLDEYLSAIVDDWERVVPDDTEEFRVLTKYVGKFSRSNAFGDWISDEAGTGTEADPRHMPWVDYSDLTDSFIREFYDFADCHTEYELTDYQKILESDGLAWDGQTMRSTDPNQLDGQTILALIMGIIRADRFNEGALLAFLEDGTLTRWLKRLKDIDWQHHPRQIKQIEFETNNFLSGSTAITLTFEGDQAHLDRRDFPYSVGGFSDKSYTKAETAELTAAFAALHVEYWDHFYNNPNVLDGSSWQLKATYSDQHVESYSGINAWPDNWQAVLEFFGISGAADPEE